MLSLKNKIAVVTGAGSEMGRSIALLLANQGATVHIIDLSLELVRETVAKITSDSGDGRAHVCNIAVQADVKLLFEGIGAMDILVNTVGRSRLARVRARPQTDFDRAMDINESVYNCLSAAIPQLRKMGGGVILNIASIGGLDGLTDHYAFASAKGAVEVMSRSLAETYVNENIRCNSISIAYNHAKLRDGTGWKGRFTRLKKIFNKILAVFRTGSRRRQIGALALYLCSDKANLITGRDYLMDYGST